MMRQEERQDKIQRATILLDQLLFDVLGVELTDSTKNTPERMAKMYVDELLVNTPQMQVDVIDSVSPYDAVWNADKNLADYLTEEGYRRSSDGEYVKSGSRDISLDRLYAQMTDFEITTDSVVSLKGIPFHSLCEHHMLPFFGTVDVFYIPNGRVIGLSKIPRIVDFFSRRLQLQERLTQDIADYIVSVTGSKYVKVTLRDVQHLCVTMRGVQADCSTDTTVEVGDHSVAR